MGEVDIEAIADLARKSESRIVTTKDGREWLVMHLDQSAQDITPKHFVPPPAEHIRQAVTLTAKDSFVDYVNAFAGETTRSFADLANAKFITFLDFHEARNDAPSAALDHRATFVLKPTEEWARWSKISGQLMPQAHFVRFLEENMADIDQPSGADILELARDFAANRKVNFTQSYRSQTGDTSFDYAVEVEGRSKTGHIDVPNKFVLRIPVYYGEPTVEVHAFLRFSIDDGALKLGIELHRPDYVRQAVFETIGREIAERTEKPMHYGAAT